jgi:tripartite-type tricarboxylate transporter receptor subunit TctC
VHQGILSLTRLRSRQVVNAGSRARRLAGIHRQCCAPVAVALCFGLLAMLSPASAEYPDRSIKSIVPFAPGGASDILARLYADHLGRALGQPIVIENKPGAGGNIGIQSVARATEDGYTILFSSIATTQNPALFRRLPYDPKDIKPVVQLGEAPFFIAVNRDRMGVRDLQEFIAAVKKAPGKYNAAAGGIGTQLAIEMLKLQNGLDVEIIIYNGTGQATTSLLTGETDFIIVDAAPLAPILGNGKIKPLALTGEKRLPAYSDVPTTREAGLPDYQERSHFGVYVPAGTPDPIVQKLHGALNRINAEPAVLKRLESLGWTPVAISTAEFEAFYRKDIAKWKDIVQRAQIKSLD